MFHISSQLAKANTVAESKNNKSFDDVDDEEEESSYVWYLHN